MEGEGADAGTGILNGRQHHDAWIKRGDAQYDDVGGNRSSEPLVWHETGFWCNRLGWIEPMRRGIRRILGELDGEN